jgi:Zn-dependent peptidase ImmA (M78 family)
MTLVQRKNLAREALAAALEVRQKVDRPLLEALCVFDVATEMEVDLWFKAIPSLEGMYSKSPGPAIIIGSERPASRRVYTCAHELGHHVFGHGTQVDELRGDDAENPAARIPEEFLAQSFAGFLLMPKLAVQNAFSTRGWRPAEATAEQIYRVANAFGVGYRTLIGHLQFGLGLLPSDRAESLAKIKLKDIRAAILRKETGRPLIVVDVAWKGRAVDLEVGNLLVGPEGAESEGGLLRMLSWEKQGTLWEPLTPGLGRLLHPASGWAANVRVARQGFAGRACFRHIPEAPDDNE